jgi:hypothetical protein
VEPVVKLRGKLPDLLKLIKVKPTTGIVISVILTTALYINWPKLLRSPYIKVRSTTNNFELVLPTDFSTCSLEFGRENGIAYYEMSYRTANSEQTATPRRQEIGQMLRVLQIHNMLQPDDRPKTVSPDSIGVKIYLPTGSPVQIISVSINGKPIPLREFFEVRLLAEAKTYQEAKYIREDIASLLLRFNDSMSNYVMAAMTFGLFPLLIELVRMGRLALFHKYLDQSIKKRFRLQDHAQIENAQANLGVEHYKKQAFFHFLQLLGPAIGFLLTTSSLIHVENFEYVADFFTLISFILIVAAFLFGRQNYQGAQGIPANRFYFSTVGRGGASVTDIPKGTLVVILQRELGKKDFIYLLRGEEKIRKLYESGTKESLRQALDSSAEEFKRSEDIHIVVINEKNRVNAEMLLDLESWLAEKSLTATLNFQGQRYEQ